MNDRYPCIHYLFLIELETFNFDTVRVIDLIISVKGYERILNSN